MKLKYICENCGKTSIYDNPEDAFNAGWDYPPRMGKFGIISPRTCGNCGIDTTLYWKLITGNVLKNTTVDGKKLNKSSLNEVLPQLTLHDKETLARILGEPESIMVEETCHGSNNSEMRKNNVIGRNKNDE